MADFIQVITTVDSEEEAQNIAGAVVGERLAACAQIIGPISSVYHWNDAIENAEEWMIVIKSRSDLFPELSGLIQQLHPYDVPEILAMPVVAGGASYLEWMGGQLKRPSGRN
ncbi:MULTISPECIES: divalent-cation tolerance protein CutA [Caldilinea]|jgi:periplasmic divalent cation tolerance protein|uniref:Putative divalent ion tolerance protein n=1 Tax=Caldilinea aerophila (strain DSM 14535 / JCM 11387 / NBRC 104270 / STL-6-O1) TaxID=926550 RepID=I0I8J0_CALAS|nr:MULTISPECIES: divalent-cation tolerance protein CutA [Caldilinea]MBO9391927.1 divalent-cation tolerance protein CutA [Caldilinea sp.]BAM01578.1 putative divalent ion tolerance protein [Caldilinea aerophila DSM 14535 = NBRC 104270]GIV72914.1 MAG: divalent cation tolerance protein [Caldilinea sp.]